MIAMVDIQTTLFVTVKWLVFPNYFIFPKSSFSNLKCSSLCADEIKLWLILSAKQCRNSCSGLPAVYPDLSLCHDLPVKKGLCLFVVIANQVEGKFEMHFW